MNRVTNKPTQCDRILAYLQTHESITPMEAWSECGVYRLGARIWDLRHKRCINIERRIVKVQNRFGETCKVAQYKMIRGN